MDDLQLLVELYRGTDRQGPGGEAETRMAIALSGLSAGRNLRIADIGCGSGASTIVLARDLDAHVTAVDMVPEFLDILKTDAARAGVAERIETRACAMEELAFGEAGLDAIWSEGAIYNIGFEAGVAAWRKFLRPGGILAVSELTWLTDDRPADLQAHWQREYPEVATASEKLALLEKHGFSPIGYFVLPESCWLDNYYRPLERRFDAFLQSQGNSAPARAVVEAQKQEISLYRQYKDFFGYGFYIARRSAD